MKARVILPGDSLPLLIRMHMEKQKLFSRVLAEAETIHWQALSGSFWITMEGDTNDYVLQAGERLQFHGPGKVVAESLEASSLLMLLGDPQA